MIRKFIVLIVLILLASVTLSTYSQTSVLALSGSDWRAGRIIDDSVFFNSTAMSASQIQNFLNAKVPTCDTNGQKTIYDSAHNDTVTRKVYAQRRGVSTPFICLKDYKQNVPSRSAEEALCNAITAGASKTAAQIIYQISQGCGVNPKVLIVLLQKEQTLVTDDWPWPIQYRSATGFGCPDTAPCDSQYYGFFNQVYNAARIFKYYAKYPNSFNHVARTTNYILYNPSTSCGGSNVYIENQATAGLYNYTPYQPNQAALNNLYGTGNSCSAYGNRNFWRMYNDWFGTTLGTPFFRIGSTAPVYTFGAQNTYYRVPSMSILKAYGYSYSIYRVESVSSAYLSGRSFAGELPLIARFERDEIYAIDRSSIHNFTSRSQFESFGYSLGDEAKLPSATMSFFRFSNDMEGIVKDSDTGKVYSVENGKKRHIISQEAYQSGSPAYSSLSSIVLNPFYLSSLSDGAPILTANKLLKSSDTNTYGFWNGSSLQKINTRTVNELGLQPDYSSSASAINQLASSGNAVNKLAKTSNGDLYILDEKQKYLVSSSDLAQLGLTNNSFVLTADDLINRITTTKNFVRIFRINNSSEVYIVNSGQRSHILNRIAVTEHGFSLAQAINLNNTSAALFPDSGGKILSTGTLFRIGSTNPVFIVNSTSTRLNIPSRTIMGEYAFSFNSVKSHTAQQVSGYSLVGNLGLFVKDSGNNSWAIQSAGIKRQLSTDMAGAAKYNLNVAALPVFSDHLMQQFTLNGQLTDLIQANGSTKVYKIENGQKHWITSRSKFQSMGLSFNNVTNVSSAFLNSITTGTNIS